MANQHRIAEFRSYFLKTLIVKNIQQTVWENIPEIQSRIKAMTIRRKLEC